MKNLGKIIIFFIFLLIFSFVSIIFQSQVIYLDEKLFYIINGFSNPVIDFILVSLTYFGSVFFWIFLTIILWIKGNKKISIYLIYALIIDAIVSFTLKWTFLRNRPENFLKKSILVEEDLGSSFPSGHSEKAFSGAVILGSHYKNFKILLYVLAILTAISRIYIGIHYPIDTFFGSIIGLVIGNLILNIPTEKFQKKIDKIIYKFKKL